MEFDIFLYVKITHALNSIQIFTYSIHRKKLFLFTAKSSTSHHSNQQTALYQGTGKRIIHYILGHKWAI